MSCNTAGSRFIGAGNMRRGPFKSLNNPPPVTNLGSGWWAIVRATDNRIYRWPRELRIPDGFTVVPRCLDKDGNLRPVFWTMARLGVDP